MADELERGNFQVSKDKHKRGLILLDPEPWNGSLFNLNEEWSKSKAKSGGSRPFDPLDTESLKCIRKNKDVMHRAKAIAKSLDFDGLCGLGEALKTAGCNDKRLLSHCQKPGELGNGCWAVNYLLGKNA